MICARQTLLAIKCVCVFLCVDYVHDRAQLTCLHTTRFVSIGKYTRISRRACVTGGRPLLSIVHAIGTGYASFRRHIKHCASWAWNANAGIRLDFSGHTDGSAFAVAVQCAILGEGRSVGANFRAWSADGIVVVAAHLQSEELGFAFSALNAAFILIALPRVCRVNDSC